MMSAVIEQPKLLTTADLLAMPDDGVERWLIRGQLRENRESDVTKRNRFHSRILIRLGALLESWRDQLPEPRGEVLGGEAGCLLSRNPDSTVGIDVAYFGPEVAEVESDGTALMDGPPVLAVVILSPSDKKRDIDEKVDQYLAAGVKVVWVIDPYRETVLSFEKSSVPRFFTTADAIVAEPHLPGFSTPVAKIFE